MILISACLAGEKCRYDGRDKAKTDLVELVEMGQAIALCPEELGGMPTPREPAERHGEQVLNGKGRDVTKSFIDGARIAWDLVKEETIEKAILKTNSPMCGCGVIYDGSFSGSKVKGDGVFTELLKEKNIPIETRD
jgi:uncharacterized protein YbbK (DUF523 family)